MGRPGIVCLGVWALFFAAAGGAEDVTVTLDATNSDFVVTQSPATERMRVDGETGVVQFNGIDLFNTGTNGSTSGSLYMGKDAGDPTLTGAYNLGVGLNALGSVTAPGTTSNTAIGARALQHVSDPGSTRNVAVGANAMQGSAGNLGVTSSNVAVGYGAMKSLDSASRSVAVGRDSLRQPLGDENVAVGNDSFYSLELGDRNIAIGEGAGEGLRNGSNNIYIGHPASDIDEGEQTVNENGKIRIGFAGTHVATYLAGNAIIDQDVSAETVTIRGGADIAEPFAIHGGGRVEPGMLLSIDRDNPGGLRLSSGAYDRAVAGVVSGAGGISAGLTLTAEGTIASGEVPVALTGRVYVWVDTATTGAVRPGDLLTTSDRSGYAMKVDDYSKAAGAILGKAMTPLAEGEGLVLVLVSLQ